MSSKRPLPAGYGQITPVANYMPWTVDVAFGETFERIRENTMVDVYRCWELWQLVTQLASADGPDPVPGDVLEVGAWRGGTAGLMATALQVIAGPRAKDVIIADTFYGVVKAGERDPYFRGGEYANTSADLVRQFLGVLGIKRFEILEGVFPEDTSGAIEDRAFALCHIDVDVYESAKDVCEWVWPRLSEGGIVVFDDYGFYGCEGVTAYVDEAKAAADRLFLQNVNGHAIFVKRGVATSGQEQANRTGVRASAHQTGGA